jgi:hypothetical protein
MVGKVSREYHNPIVRQRPADYDFNIHKPLLPLNDHPLYHPILWRKKERMAGQLDAFQVILL